MAQNFEKVLNGFMPPGQISENQFQQLNQMNQMNPSVALALSLRGTVQNPFAGQAMYQQQQQPIQHSMQQQMNDLQFLQQQEFINADAIQQLYAQFMSQQTQVQTPKKHHQPGMNGDALFYQDMFKTSAFKTPTKPAKPLCELQRIALAGCESAQKIFPSHSKRPYFKKIDLLCDRLKQDLTVTDRSVININSHGIAWAIKDFIFVFNRIMSAWIILRDYVYSTSDGMTCVQSAIDPNFQRDFMVWQDATIALSRSLINSYENLHARDQRNGNRKGNFKDSGHNNSPRGKVNPMKTAESFQNLFDPLIAENSEQAQLNGGYLKSAVYKPVSSSSSLDDSSPPDSPGSSIDFDVNALKAFFDDVLPCNGTPRTGNPKPLYKRGSAEPAKQGETHSPSGKYQPRGLSQKFNKMDVKESGGNAE